VALCFTAACSISRYLARSGSEQAHRITPTSRRRWSISPRSHRSAWCGNTWPHRSLFDPPNDAQLFDCIAERIPDTTLRQRIPVDYPARLYGFW